MAKNNGFLSRLFSKKKKTQEYDLSGYNVRGYDGAKINNTNFHMPNFSHSEDNETYNALRVMRARSRDKAKNSNFMQRYLQTMTQNVIGANGFKLKVLAKDINTKLDTQGNLAVSRAWDDWCKRRNCDFKEQVNFTEMLNVIFEAVIKDGECIVRKVREKSNGMNKYGYKLQMLDIERLAIDCNMQLDDGFIRMGVEMDNYGRIRAYHLHIPQSNNTMMFAGRVDLGKYERIDVRDLKHLFLVRNPEQTRGMPWAHTAIIAMDDLQQFNASLMTAGKLGSVFSVFVKKMKGSSAKTIATTQGSGGFRGGNNQDPANSAPIPPPTPALQLGYGNINQVDADVDVQSFKGDYPAQAFEKFTEVQRQEIAAGLNLSPTNVTNDVKNLNYSVARTVLIDDRSYYKKLQKWLIDNFIAEVYEEWLEQALLNNKIKVDLPNGDLGTISADKYEKFLNYNFIGRSWEAVDPQKEAVADKMAYDNLLKPKQDILAERGLDIEEVLYKYKEEHDLITSILGKDFKLPSVDPDSDSNVAQQSADSEE